MHALKSAAKNALMKEESTPAPLSDGDSDDVVLVQQSEVSVGASARDSARCALQHLEHAYMEVTKSIQDHSKEKKDGEWLDSVQDRLDLVVLLMLRVLHVSLFLYSIADAIGDLLLGGPQTERVANDRFNRILDICLAYRSTGNAERFIKQCVHHLGDTGLVWEFIRKH